MKQYTNESQTTKLIELGFEKPKNISGYCQRDRYEYDAENNTKMLVYDDAHYPIYRYSIGELIEMLPEAVCLSYDDSVHYYLEISSNALYWNVAYKDGSYEAYSVESDELIDALYYMIVKLKEEGVI